ncbi:Acetyltransferase [Streptomyces sp. enrichment culture]|uniref:GNAT family N-acetyltransferase n=1 Tax=Streptomyces TaxID=1883 RepID=UPI00167AC74F|nr:MULTISPECIES: GNAT family N-acetyltransferase [Streptomyces]MBD3575768.1 GNAT family N-acetyltransferase [Streptomyces sp. KD18]GGT31297.1 N-acetyltransferase [Streptomyces toxytricini]
MTEIRTPRLLLRRWSDDDVVPLSEINADPAVMHWTGDGSPLDPDATAGEVERWEEEWDDEGFGQFAVELLASGELIGAVGLSVVADDLPGLPSDVEIRWRLGRQFWGQGYASEAAQAALEFALQDRGVDRVVAVVRVGDHASANVAEKLGMAAEREITHPEQGHALQVYAIDLTEYAA